MNRHNILFLPHNIEITVEHGENLIRAAMEAGVHINASCGGEGVCGKCRVIIEDGNVDGGITEKLDKKDIEKGYRQACLSDVLSDLVVRIPIESEVDAGVLNLQKTPRNTARIWEMNLEELKDKGLFMPPVEKKYLELPEPTAQDNLPDVTRLISFLKATYDEHRLVVQLPVIRKISDILRQDDFKVTATLARPVQSGRKTH
ncbi:MAG: 2Fe-2S iron-sulfur cluster-binding protein, partial [Desulfobacteraceae bacterium]|nr:2Fe-2S iron-sulfur cluster-binding protein [Desulfobacteraceae bacterium]